MTRKLKIYLDTTIVSYVFNEHVPDKQKAAAELLAQISKGGFADAFISEVVIDELRLIPEPRQSQIAELIKEVKVLELTDEAAELAREYTAKGIIPEKNRNDALHIALASIYEMDMLVSYNFEHIVKLKTIDGVTAINLLRGIRTPRIVIPEEVL